MTNDRAPILTAYHLHKMFPSRRGNVSALEDVSFRVNRGEFLCIVGPSGCGKTTLLRLLSGLLPPDHGEVLFDGEPLQSPRAEIGLVFQKSNLMPWRSVWRNVMLPLEIDGRVNTPDAERVVRHALKLVGLTEFSHSYPHELSGGMQQRVAIARTLVHQPQVLLLDEPFGALDALTRENLNLELANLWRELGATVVMVTHNIREAVFLADRVLVLSPRPGRLTAAIPVDIPRPRDISLLYDGAFNDVAFRVRQAIE